MEFANVRATEGEGPTVGATGAATGDSLGSAGASAKDSKALFDEQLRGLLNAARKNHKDLLEAYESLVESHGNDVASVMIECFKSNVASIPELLGVLDRIDGCANALLKSPLNIEFLNGLAKTKTVSNKARVAFMDLLLSPANRSTYLGGISEDTFVILSTFCVGLIASDDMGLSEKACVVLSDMMSISMTPLLLVIETAGRHASSSVVYMRFLQVIAHAASLGDAQFAECVACGGIGLIVATCRSTDLLLAITAIELLSVFATSRAGLNHLVLNGVLQWLMDTASAADSLLRIEALREIASILANASKRRLLDAIFLESLQVANILRRFLLCLQDQLAEGSEEAKVAGTVVVVY
jgi:hypothetical protein